MTVVHLERRELGRLPNQQLPIRNWKKTENKTRYKSKTRRKASDCVLRLTESKWGPTQQRCPLSPAFDPLILGLTSVARLNRSILCFALK